MKDHRLVRIALFLFFVATSLVYAVFIQIRSDDIRKDVVTIVQKYWLVDVIASTWNGLTGVVWTWLWGFLSGEQPSIDDWLTVDEWWTFFDEILGTGKTQILSGTELYYGSIDVFKTIGIRYEYILKDKTYDIFYAYIGSGKTYDVSQLVKWIWWKTVEIYAKNDIINNLYFWDRVTFVELPGVSPTTTSLFVRIGNDMWFIQDISWQYKKHKRHIRTLFTLQ
jgi:hypothetical protein